MIKITAGNSTMRHDDQFPRHRERSVAIHFLNSHTLCCMDCRAAFQAARNDGGRGMVVIEKTACSDASG